ncbi:MAG: hypothetical protein WD069_07585 [Planctomycetales bacterium]
MASSQLESRKTVPGGPAAPVLRTTRYDKITSGLLAGVIGLVVAVVCLFLVWAALWRTEVVTAIPFELVEAGGVPEGAPDETLQLESPEDVTEDPALEESPIETEVSETLETVIELADQATEQVQEQFELEPDNTGQPGSAEGTGRRALGMGPGVGGFPNEERWFVQFGDNESLDAYAAQLDFFGIEIAVWKGDTITYVKNLSQARPDVRVSNKGDANRLFFSWRGGGRKEGDLKLFQKAGVDVAAGQIIHLYPRETEIQLAIAERDYRGRTPDQIHRTYFVVRGTPGNYQFVVTKQTYLN